ncbi:thiopeptide-type bacteriocin biosynthesis protein [Flagellimonas sp. S174]|uniref:thiopeptide-type bacteriocin biosynthesis protein n=1 Tax=Flagellimonas sp. S174 TaxID=3410790 RepID=UPI003BF56716
MTNKLKRNFSVGSEWLYYKIYSGPKTSDLVLTEIVKPTVKKLIKKNYIDKWFFIRYSDPHHHLRVRFHCSDIKNIGEVISLLYKPLNKFLELDIIWKVQLDTYQREIERYGANTMEISETLFHFDSEATVDFLDLIEGEEGERLRWLFGLRSIDQLLNSFNYSPTDKLTLMDNLKTGFGREFGMSRPLKKQLDEKYRKDRGNIETFMKFNEESIPEYKPILAILTHKKKNLDNLAKELLEITSNTELLLDFDDLISSYIHMLMVRLFKSKNRLNEMVSYDFLYRYYRTQIAVSKKANKN